MQNPLPNCVTHSEIWAIEVDTGTTGFVVMYLASYSWRARWLAMHISLSCPIFLRELLHSEDVPETYDSSATTPLVTEFLDRGHTVAVYTFSQVVDKETLFLKATGCLFLSCHNANGVERMIFSSRKLIT